MDTTEIRRIAIDSAEKYFRYLEQNNKGLQTVEVYDIIRQEKKGIYKLRLSAKLFDIDAIFFKLYTNNRLYTTGEVRVIEYDADKNVLLIKPETELIGTFETLSAKDVTVISDLKFLIERIKKWYELKGAEIAFPIQQSILRNSFTSLRYLPGLEPSANQKAALQLIFQAPFSYIWGAPGTGKTQFVLSYAILHYLSNNKKVAIFAPTNNAIEQVLRGVIKMTDKAGVSRSKILRLGVPTRKFAEEYPEVCEEMGMMKKLEELDKQIERIKKVLGIHQERFQLEQAIKNLSAFDFIPALQDTMLAMQQDVEQSREAFLVVQGEVEKIRKNIGETENRRDVISRKINSLGHRIGKWVSRKASRSEIELQQIYDSLTELNVRQQHWVQELNAKEAHYQSLKVQYEAQEKKFKQAVNDIKDKFSFIESLKNIISGWRGKEPGLMKNKLFDQLLKELEQMDDDELITDEYKTHDRQGLEKQLELLEETRKRLAAFSTEERLKGVSVVACTLDGYVGRFTENKLQVDHVFMDEAGYANIIKALTLFNLKAPVTFLGDHKQLPPVCEINDGDIKNNTEYHNVFLWAQSAIFLEGLFDKTRDVLLQEYLTNTPLRAVNMQQADLIHTFRFGKRLAEILNKHVYVNNFTSSLDKGDTRLFYIHASKTDGFKSRISSGEVQAIAGIVQQLPSDEEFVILTPYKKQVQALGRALPKERNDLRILTVHGSQGREWDTVILSVVDTGDKWFVDSRLPLSNGLNLLNTAVSRTKKRLIIVCDYGYWQGQAGQLVTDLLAASEQYSPAV